MKSLTYSPMKRIAAKQSEYLGIRHIKRNAEATPQLTISVEKTSTCFHFSLKHFFREKLFIFFLFSLDIFMQINFVADG